VWSLPPRILAARRLVVLTAGDNPTFSYYIAPRLNGLPHRVVDTAGVSAHSLGLSEGDYVLACRYLPPVLLLRVLWARCLAGLGMLIDDDFAAFVRDSTLPLAYRSAILARGLAPLRLLDGRLADLIVSTPALAERVGGGKAAVLHPAPAALDLSPRRRSANGRVRVAFHAQLSHLADHAFAAEIARCVLDRASDLDFDVIGPSEAQRHWRGLPHVRFRSELTWSQYRALTRAEGADLLMAPLLDTEVNRSRAPTKAIDAVRMGAAAVFADLPPYRALAPAARLVGQAPGAWADALLHLARARNEREHLAEALRVEVRGWHAALAHARHGS
jgi:hypothetical protein